MKFCIFTQPWANLLEHPCTYSLLGQHFSAVKGPARNLCNIATSTLCLVRPTRGLTHFTALSGHAGATALPLWPLLWGQHVHLARKEGGKPPSGIVHAEETCRGTSKGADTPSSIIPPPSYLQGRAKKNPAKFSDKCSVMAVGLCIGCLKLVGRRTAENFNMQEIFFIHPVQSDALSCLGDCVDMHAVCKVCLVSNMFFTTTLKLS